MLKFENWSFNLLLDRERERKKEGRNIKIVTEEKKAGDTARKRYFHCAVVG
jgi:hypothetical protein